MKHLLSILIFIFLFASCDVINENFYPRTLKALNSCIKNLESEQVADKTIKNICIKKHQRPVSFTSFEGKTRIVDGYYKSTVKNKSDYDIITSVKIHLGHFINYEEQNYQFNILPEDDTTLLPRIVLTDCKLQHIILDAENNIIENPAGLCEYKTWEMSFEDLWIEPGDEIEIVYDLEFEPGFMIWDGQDGITNTSHRLLEINGFWIE